MSPVDHYLGAVKHSREGRNSEEGKKSVVKRGCKRYGDSENQQSKEAKVALFSYLVSRSRWRYWTRSMYNK